MPPSSELLQDELRAAVEAARTGDVREFLIRLAASHAVDAITQRLVAKWSRAEWGNVEAAVLRATETLFARARDGALIRSPAGFLWGCATNDLSNQHRAGVLVVSPYQDCHSSASWDPSSPDSDRDDEAIRVRALKFARSLLPRLGQDNIIRVMTFVLDCVEAGEKYVDHKIIAEATGLTADTVRKLKHRGFERLEREAKRHGVLLDDSLDPAQHLEEDEE